MGSARDVAFVTVIAALSLLVSITVVVPANAKETAIDRVKWVCGQVDDHASCLDVFLSSPKTNKTKDMRALANLALDLGNANATQCADAVKQLHAKPGLPAALLPVLDFCAGRFGTSAFQFEVAKADLEVDPDTANYDVNLAYDGPRDCDQQMADKNVTNAEVAALGMNIRFFAKIGDAVTTALME